MRLRHKLLWVLVVTSLAGAMAVAAGATWLMRAAVRENFAGRIRVETSLLADWARAVERERAQSFAEQAAARLGARVTLIDGEGVVLADSAKDARGVLGMDNHIDRPEIAAARLRGSGEVLRRSGTTNVLYLYVARLVEGTGPVKYARIALPASEVQAVQARYQWLLAAVVLASLILLSVVAYLAVRRLSKPVERMSAIADRITGGQLDLVVPESARDEVGRLGGAVNRMKQSLLEKTRELREEHALLRSVVGDMREGLLLVAPDRRVRLANPAVRRILGVTFDPTGHLLAEVLRQPEALRLIETVMEQGAGRDESVVELPGSGRAFELHVTPLAGRGGVLVLFFDITRLEALERVRREFVANVSHELRTPLTSIKAFVETLTAGGLDDREHAAEFLGIIGKHADRMDALIDDITDLSRIETGAVQLEFENVALEQIVREVVRNLRPSIERYGVRVSVDLPSPFEVRADRRRLEQVLTNLVDNAIKFNRPGGSVRIHGASGAGGTTVVVDDSGIGIPADSLERIFHRFYRVDPGRSREAGGTGLGLAIVKHLMRLHGGQVYVESELGRGSRFTLEFPSRPRDAEAGSA